MIAGRNSLDFSSSLKRSILYHLHIDALDFRFTFSENEEIGIEGLACQSVLLSSTFLLGLDVTIRLGVPISTNLLSEGLPFLVVVISFSGVRGRLQHFCLLAALILQPSHARGTG